MKRRNLCFGTISSVLLGGCGPGDPCEAMGGLIRPIYFKINNRSASTIYTNLSFSEVGPGKSEIGWGQVLRSSTCDGPPNPPPVEVIATQFFVIKKASVSGDSDGARVFFGGPRAEHDKMVAQDSWSFLAKATLHAHSLFFVPGSQVRQDMGLVVNNPTGTEIFTSLDPWRPYQYKGFTLNIDVHDLDAGDIRMSVTGTLAN